MFDSSLSLKVDTIQNAIDVALAMPHGRARRVALRILRKRMRQLLQAVPA